jgi:FKBP-type peptidyl-prolyl cis-trans isomerase
MRSFFILALLGVVLATIAIGVRSGIYARKNPGQPINSAMRAAMETPQFSTGDAMIIAQKYPNAHRTESGLLYVVHEPGKGPTPFKGQIVSVQYVGTFLDGRKFDSSIDRGEPFNFAVGFGRVIPAWDEAFGSMRSGEKRTLIVPYWLGYGERGRGKIPERTTLVFEVELLGIDRTSHVGPEDPGVSENK